MEKPAINPTIPSWVLGLSFKIVLDQDVLFDSQNEPWELNSVVLYSNWAKVGDIIKVKSNIYKIKEIRVCGIGVNEPVNPSAGISFVRVQFLVEETTG